MNQTKELNIVRISPDGKKIEKDLVIREIPFTILVNGKEIVTLLCSPDKLEYLAVGFLLSEGLIRTDTLIKDVNLGKDGYYATVELISSGCGRGSSFYDPRDIKNCKPLNSDIKISYKQIINLMKGFQEKSSLFKETGGVHSAALSSPNEIEIFAEDIGRHNAIDKIFGECLIKKMPTENKIILTSGRISSEILIKITKRKIPIIISRAAPTDLAVDSAEKMRVTLIGFVRGERMNIYTHNLILK